MVTGTEIEELLFIIRKDSLERAAQRYNDIYDDISKKFDKKMFQNLVEKMNNCIEIKIGDHIRELDTIRERNLKEASIEDIDNLKKGYAELFNFIESTLHWDEMKKSSLFDVINRESLRTKLIDPQVSVKEKQKIMDKLEDFV